MTLALRSGTRRLVLLSACALGLLTAGCGEKAQTADTKGGGGGGSGKGGRGGGGAAPVVVGNVVRKKVPLVIDAIGAVEATRMAGVRSQVTGILQKIAIKEGQDVKEGDLLFELDQRSFRNALQVAQADLERLNGQLATAKLQVERYATLDAGQMVPKEQFQKIQSEARALEAQVKAKESDVANARLQLDFSSIRAPISGRTGNLAVHEGDLVRLNEATALVTINQLTPIYVTFGVPQQHLAALNRYRAERSLEVKVAPPGVDEKPVLGELTFVDNMVDAATGTIKLKATFPNADQRLWPGQFASVTVTLAEPEVLTVPTAAIQNSQAGQFVFVVSGDRIAEQRPVTVERSYENDAVISKGLAEGDTIIVDGQLRVVPGRAVDIKGPGGSGGGRGEGKKGGGTGAGGGKKKKETEAPKS